MHLTRVRSVSIDCSIRRILSHRGWHEKKAATRARVKAALHAHEPSALYDR
jgi:hypothetical protein